jgi:glycogen debranching enzyme
MRKLLLILSLFTTTNCFSQTIISDNKSISDAFKLAVGTVDVNTRRGILAAGGDYGGDWTRDIAINSWNGVGLLRPEIAVKSLWSVTVYKDTIGLQYWDKIIWTIAAYNYYKVTGDKEFLRPAYKCAANTMEQLEQQTFDKEYGLFRGPSVFNDGIAGYPEPVYEPSNYSSGVVDHKGSRYIKCLSTNSIYYGAYVALIKMAETLKMNEAKIADYKQKSAALKRNILKHLYHQDTNTFSYLIDQNGKPDNSQEGLGISFVVLFGIVDGPQANQLISHAVVSKFGITSIYPDFPRYSPDKPGRHNNIIWPMVNGFFAKAAIAANDYATFTNELYSLTHLALDEDKGNYDFREIYNPYSGKPDGGWQRSGSPMASHWESCRLQTWSATAYISMILNGVIGLRFNESSLVFAPYLPAGVNYIELKDIAYRKATLNIAIKGKGNKVKRFTVDGKTHKNQLIASSLQGKHSVFIEVE